MNETIATIMRRRTIRKFKNNQISDENLQQILDCAIHAPNSRNSQQWHFTVVQNADMISKLVDTAKTNIENAGIPFLMEKIQDPNYHTFYGAPTAIFVSGPKTEKYTGVDCGIAAENMMLAAESLGIGSVCLGSTALLFESDAPETLEKELQFPEGYGHVCVVALGYTDGESPATPERKTDVFSYIK